MASMSKHLAPSNKPRETRPSQHLQEAPGSAGPNRGVANLANGWSLPALHDDYSCASSSLATDATGKAHKRSSTNHVYSHCQWSINRAPAEHPRPGKDIAADDARMDSKPSAGRTNANRWRKEPSVGAIEILEARQARRRLPSPNLFPLDSKSFPDDGVRQGDGPEDLKKARPARGRISGPTKWRLIMKCQRAENRGLKQEVVVVA